jgi:hypothetical protein
MGTGEHTGVPDDMEFRRVHRQRDAKLGDRRGHLLMRAQIAISAKAGSLLLGRTSATTNPHRPPTRGGSYDENVHWCRRSHRVCCNNIAGLRSAGPGIRQRPRTPHPARTRSFLHRRRMALLLRQVWLSIVLTAPERRVLLLRRGLHRSRRLLLRLRRLLRHCPAVV